MRPFTSLSRASLLILRNVTKNFDAEPFSLTKVLDSVKLLDLQNSSKEKLIVILGATATGKSALALKLAEFLGTEIISADSMAVYKRFNIGTAKPSAAELRRVKHHLIDILEPNEIFSVVEFVRRASEIITEINSRGKIPIVVGGTGLYIQALVEGYKFGEYANTKSRENFLNDTGTLKYDAQIIGLTSERSKLYDRINERTRQMFEDGLVEEVRTLLSSGVSPTAQAMLGIGYRETVEYLRGEFTLAETISKVSQATRNFAKRQLTWYRRMSYINFFDVG